MANDSIEQRLKQSKLSFQKQFGREAEICFCSPGRAEIIGNHTDYNEGFAISCAIDSSIVGAAGKRSDDLVLIGSSLFDDELISFSLTNIKTDRGHWSSYPKAVAAELLNLGYHLQGIEVCLDSNLSLAGGVSSSASLEIAVAGAFRYLCGLDISDLQLAILCKEAENGPLVGVPCGLLDQATITLAQSDKFLLIDFRPQENVAIQTSSIDTHFDPALNFVIAQDRSVRRKLGETGYPARRALCQQSVILLSALLKRPIAALRDVSTPELFSLEAKFRESGKEVMFRRALHVVSENERVQAAVLAMQSEDWVGLGKLLTASGTSALDLYDLDEGTPELRSLVEVQLAIPGVLGVRNMGGGFSALTLALVDGHSQLEYERLLTQSYYKDWGRELDYITFRPAQGLQVFTC